MILILKIEPCTKTATSAATKLQELGLPSDLAAF